MSCTDFPASSLKLIVLAGTPATGMVVNSKKAWIWLPVLTVASGVVHSATTGDAVLVTATRQATRVQETLADVTVIDRDQIEQAGGATLGELLARQPGVQLISNGAPGASSSIVLRGGANERHTLVLMDGLRIGSASKGALDAWSRIPLSQVERIEIVRGPMSAVYGADAVGGVINIITKSTTEGFALHGEVGVGSNDTYAATAGFAGSSNGWRYGLNVSDFRTNGFNSRPQALNTTLVPPKQYNADRDGFSLQSASGNISYSLAPGTEIGGTFFVSSGDSQYDASSSPTGRANKKDDKIYQAVDASSIYGKFRLSDRWASTLRVGLSDDRSHSMSDAVQSSYFNTRQDQYLWQNDVKFALGEAMMALERVEQTLESSTAYAVRDRRVDSALAGVTLGVDAHRLQANVRHDDNSQFGAKNTGSVAYGYQISDSWRMNVGYGTAFRAPTFNELYYQPASAAYTSNPNLRPETSKNREIGAYYAGAVQRFSTVVYDNRITDMITSGGVLENVQNANIRGISFAYDATYGDYLVSANYDHVDPKDEQTGNVLRRKAKNFGNTSLGRRWGAWEWRVELQANGHRFDDDANTVDLHGYVLTNLYGTYRLKDGWSVFARANNIFNRNYELAKGYDTPAINFFLGIRYTPQ